jgi:site-specific DNA recombinase
LQKFRKLDVTKDEQRKQLIDTFINAIYLYDDKIIFTLNYKDSTKTITFDEINGSDLESSGAPY